MPPVAVDLVASNITIIPAQEAFLVDATIRPTHLHGGSRFNYEAVLIGLSLTIGVEPLEPVGGQHLDLCNATWTTPQPSGDLGGVGTFLAGA